MDDIAFCIDFEAESHAPSCMLDLRILCISFFISNFSYLRISYSIYASSVCKRCLSPFMLSLLLLAGIYTAKDICLNVDIAFSFHECTHLILLIHLQIEYTNEFYSHYIRHKLLRR